MIRTNNIFYLLILRLLIVFLIYTLCRLAFYSFNYSYFNDLKTIELINIFLFGLRFDISIILLINLPVIFFSTIPFRFRTTRIYLLILKLYFIIINSLAIGVNLVDVIYFRFTFKRTTADIFKYLDTGEEFSSLIPTFIRDFWYMLLIWAALIIVLVLLFNKLKFLSRPQIKNKLRYYILNSFLFLIIIFFTIIGIRGGFQLRPLSILVAGKYANAKNVPLVLNTPYTFLTTINKSELSVKNYFDPDRLVEIYTPIHTRNDNESFNKKNIVIIIVESLSLEHIGSLNTFLANGKYKGYTPFLDSLIQHSLVFKAFANGKRSIEGIPAILSGIPSLMNNSYTTSPYAGNNINSLASLLKRKSYYSSFFHGGNNGTMGFDNYTKLAGFDSYYGRNEYNKEEDFDGKWGIFDEEFLQFASNEISTFQSPFLTTIFTLSAHHPYSIPDKHIGRFKEGNLEIQKCIEYTDYSIRKFFETSSKSSWYKNTIFVITADHTSESYYPYYTRNPGMFAIPIIFFDPDTSFKGISHKLAQQIDIMPSLLDILNYDEDYLAFGTSVFDTLADRFSINYLNNNYQLIRGNYLMQFDGNQAIALFDVTKDTLLKNNLVNSDIARKKEMEEFIMAFIQQYNNRLFENRLTVNNGVME